MTTSLGHRSCLLLAAAALGGCFDPLPEGIDDDDDVATTGDPTTGSSGPSDPTMGPTTDDPTAGSTGGPDTTTGAGTQTGGSSGGGEDESSSGDDTSGGQGESSSGGETDLEPPSVETMQPADGAAGVLSDAEIELVFSEPMDTASVELALDASDLEPFELTWDEDGTTLTLTPDAPLAYAAGMSPVGTEALAFSVTVGTSATDVAGNELQDPFSGTFTTARRITVSLDHDPGYTGAVVSNGVLQTGAGDDPVVGDHDDNMARRGFIGFSIAPLPAGILEIEDAELRADQWLTLGDPMPSLGNAVSIAHIAAEPLPGGAYASTPLADLGIFSDEDGYAADNTKTADVTANVGYDYAEGESHSLYRLSMPTATNFNSTTDRLRYNDEVLEVTYLLP